MNEELVAFLYVLLRDEVAPGRIERIVIDHEKHPGPYKFSNVYLEGYARELAGRITTRIV